MTDLVKQQLPRYLLVGGFNTVFGYSTFACLTYLFSLWLREGYLLASMCAGVINITVSFLTLKRFVFRTHGNYVNEWLKSFAVYGSSILIGTALLYPAVGSLIWLGIPREISPYFAGMLLLILQVAWGFTIHRRFTFSN
jgi:putative flippase GtrA